MKDNEGDSPTAQVHALIKATEAQAAYETTMQERGHHSACPACTCVRYERVLRQTTATHDFW